MASQSVERRLAAIMFTDIVGFTALMAESEAKGLRAKEQHRALVRPLVERYHGECIEARGDESLSVFPSTLDAVNCALAVESELSSSELKLHIGIHLGDISIEHGEISGDGVNIAARVCALSEGGGLCVSDEVHQAVRNQPDIQVTPLGERELKNVGRPVPVYRLSGPASAPSRRRISRRPIYVQASIPVALLALLVVLGWWYQRPSPDRAAGLAGRPAIAVLPFENLGGDPEQSIFAEALADDLITRLGSWRSFPVIARASSFNPGLPKDVQQAGQELRAHYVVVGSVRRAQDRIRINVQLIDTASGRNVWANQYDRDFSDVLALQDEITETIIGEVNPDLLQFESERAICRREERLEIGNGEIRLESQELSQRDLGAIELTQLTRTRHGNLIGHGVGSPLDALLRPLERLLVVPDREVGPGHADPELEGPRVPRTDGHGTGEGFDRLLASPDPREVCAVAVVGHRVARIELDPERKGADHPVRLPRHGKGVTQGVMGFGAELLQRNGRLGCRKQSCGGLLG